MPHQQDEPNVFSVEPRENIEKHRSFHKSDLTPGDVDQRIILEGLITARGLIANRPDGTTHIQQFYAEDEKKLYIWNRINKAWEVSSFS